MTNRTLGWWLLVAFAIVGLAVTAPVVSAHGGDPTHGTTADGIVTEGDTTGWAGWMNDHMTDQMGLDAIDEMESHMGVTVDELPHDPPEDNHTPTGLNGQGYGC
ncbi:hypothetical protein [Halohasta litorea]|uniref:Uncharacterized protein n=1 Tax=Halohasta litorea TaxID=869891 RepID=A0ABD6DAS4_9EURY|nr:hypothetical protein [Halohasta litorea]